MSCAEMNNATTTTAAAATATLRCISHVDVLRESKELDAVYHLVDQTWDLEAAQYETTQLVKTKSGRKRLPRRNYPNSEGIIEDASLFPYDTACYPLLDAYDRITTGIEEQLEVDEDILPVVFHCEQEDEEEMDRYLDEYWTAHYYSGDVPSYLPNSSNAIIQALDNLNEKALHERCEILLKLLTHSMSDLQSDLRLSRQVIQKLSDWKCLQDLDVLRRVLATFLRWKKTCNGRCSDHAHVEEGCVPDHFCVIYNQFERSLGKALTDGINKFTYDHIVIICAFFKWNVDEANKSAGEAENEIILNKGSESRILKSRTTQLKQAIYLHNQADFESDSENSDGEADVMPGDSIPYRVLSSFLEAMDLRIQTVHRAAALVPSNMEENHFDLRVAIGMLLFFGETAVRRLPVKRESAQFGGNIVNCLVTAFCGPLNVKVVEGLEFVNSTLPHDNNYRIYRQAGLPSILDANRYADKILKSAKQHRYSMATDLAKPVRPTQLADDTPCPASILPKPSQDVFDVLQCLWGRGLVDMEIAGCGYGDCMVWMGGPIAAHDPFLFIHSDNFVTHSTETSHWVSETIESDECHYPLRHDEVMACYDLSLLKLIQAWYAPWSPDSNHSFHRPFRAAVKTMLLCVKRIGLPNDMALHVASFLPRNFWPDDTARCWCDDCLSENAVSLMTWKLGGCEAAQAPNLAATKYCSGCKVIVYKNAAHRKRDKRNHCKDCNKPPFRIPGREEAQFCKAVAARISGTEDEMDMDDDDEEDDEGGDDGSWESMDSNEESVDSTRERLVSTFIYDWFHERTYKSQRSEESGFLAMYNRDD